MGDCGLSDNSGVGDWRLPSLAEWEATVEFAGASRCADPALTNTAGSGCYQDGPQPFTGVQSDSHWAATTLANYPTFAQSMYLSSGDAGGAYLKTRTLYVWPVRAGK